MVMRAKTIEYAFLQYLVSLASATRYDFDPITLYIPETASRLFRSVIIEVTCMDDVTTATSMTANLLGIKLGSVAFDDNSNTVTIVNSGEQMAFHFMRDATAYFNTNFGAGASQTCQVGVQFTGPSVINITAKLVITYEYDDSGQTTKIKTVRIPLESGLSALTTSLTEIGTNQVPALDTFLPEASKTYRDIFFEIEGNEFAAGTVDFQHACALDAEAENYDGLHEQGLQSARWWRRIWRRIDMATDAAHAFKMSVTDVGGGTCNHLSVVLVVTYEYNHSTSTIILNSLVMPIDVVPTITSGIAAGDKDTRRIKFLVEETNPVLVQSGIKLDWSNDAASNLSVACGSQSARAYVDAAGVFCGGIVCSHRIDSGSGGGAGFAITRGENAFTINVYSSVANVRHSALGGLLILNYTSDKHASGDGVHNHTIVQVLHTKNASLNLVQLATVQPQIPETNFWLTQVGWIAHYNKYGTTIGVVMCSVEAERTTGEGPETGFEVLGSPTFGFTDPEAGVHVHCVDCSKNFDRYIDDPDSERLTLETSRSYALKTVKTVCGSRLLMTYHSIPYTVSGILKAYTGDGSGVTVEVHRTDTDEKVLVGTTAAGGSFSLTWYDNVIALYAQARQSATKVGRSDDAVAV
jgi:hypothetical protein